MTTDTGGPAFPCDLTSYDDEVRIQYQGMTLRDYAAIKAMQGLLSATKTSDGEMIARDSYKMADAMLKARSRHERRSS